MSSVRRAAGRLLVPLMAMTIAAGGAACTTARVTATERSSIEQRLLVRSLERAAAQLDATSLVGPRVRIELFTLTRDGYFAREFLRARLETRGVRFVAPGEDADVVIQLFTAALAVDTADTLVGLPAMQAPILAVPIPEIALFKLERSRGRVEVQTYTYDRDGRLLTRLGDAKGEARYDRLTLLIFITFSVTDLDKPAEQSSAH